MSSSADDIIQGDNVTSTEVAGCPSSVNENLFISMICGLLSKYATVLSSETISFKSAIICSCDCRTATFYVINLEASCNC